MEEAVTGLLTHTISTSLLVCDTSEFESTTPFDPGGAVTGVAELGVDAIEAALTGGATVTVTTEDAGGADNGGDTGNYNPENNSESR